MRIGLDCGGVKIRTLLKDKGLGALERSGQIEFARADGN